MNNLLIVYNSLHRIFDTVKHTHAVYMKIYQFLVAMKGNTKKIIKHKPLIESIYNTVKYWTEQFVSTRSIQSYKKVERYRELLQLEEYTEESQLDYERILDQLDEI